MAARRCLDRPNHACFKVKLNTPASAWHCGRLWCTLTKVGPAWFLGVILLLYVPPTFNSQSSQRASNLQSHLICLTLNRFLMFVCLWQGLWRHPACHPEVRPFLHSNESRLISLPPELLHWLVLTSHFVLERTPLPNLIHFYSCWFFVFFCLDCRFFCRSRHVGECLGVCWVCACLSVFVCSLQLPPLITVPLQTDAAPG